MPTLKKCLNEISINDLSKTEKDAILDDATTIRGEGVAAGSAASVKAITNFISDIESEISDIQSQIDSSIGARPSTSLSVTPVKKDRESVEEEDVETSGRLVTQVGIGTGKMGHGVYFTNKKDVKEGFDHPLGVRGKVVSIALNLGEKVGIVSNGKATKDPYPDASIDSEEGKRSFVHRFVSRAVADLTSTVEDPDPAEVLKAVNWGFNEAIERAPKRIKGWIMRHRPNHSRDLVELEYPSGTHTYHQTIHDGRRVDSYSWLDMDKATTASSRKALNDARGKISDKLNKMGYQRTARWLSRKTYESGQELYEDIQTFFSRSLNPSASASNLLLDSKIDGTTSKANGYKNYVVFDNESKQTDRLTWFPSGPKMSSEDFEAVKDMASKLVGWFKDAGLSQEVIDHLEVKLSPVIDLDGKDYADSEEKHGGQIERVLGATTVDGIRALVEISSMQSQDRMSDTAYHEAFHVAMAWLIPQSEHEKLLARFKGNDEAAAKAYAKYVARRKLGHKILKKMPVEVQMIFNGVYKAVEYLSQKLNENGYVTPRHYFDALYMGKYEPNFGKQLGATHLMVSKDGELPPQFAKDSVSVDDIQLGKADAQETLITLANMAGGPMMLKKYLIDKGWDKQSAARAQSIARSIWETPFPTPEATAKNVIDTVKDNPEQKAWYEKTEFLSKVLENENGLNLFRNLAMLAHTSRNKSPLGNMVEFIKFRASTKAGDPFKGGLVTQKVLDRVLNAKNLEEMFDITMQRTTGLKGGELKVKNFAETFAIVSRNPDIRQDLEAVLDIWMNRYFFPMKKINTVGAPAALSPVEIDRAQSHIRSVQKVIEDKTGEKWYPDQVQAALWLWTKENWSLHEKGSSQKGYTFDDSLRVLAERWAGQMDNDVMSSYINQKLRDPDVRHILDRWSKKGREWVHPNFQGTGLPGREWTAQPSDKPRPKRMHFYEAGTRPERQFENFVRTRSVIDSSKIYDIGKDPNGYRDKFGINTMNPDPSLQAEMERKIIEDGYIGMVSMPSNVTVMFEPTKTYKMNRYTLNLSPMVTKGQITQAKKAGDIEGADRLQRIMDLEKENRYEELYETIEADIRKIFDHPLVDFRAILPAEGRWKGGREFAISADIEAGDIVVLKGLMAEFLKKYRQMAGFISEAKSGLGEKKRPAGIPAAQAESVVITIDKDLNNRDLSKVSKILNDNGIGGSTYVPEYRMLVVHHTKDGGQTKVTFRKSILSSIDKIDKTFRKYNVESDTIWQEHSVIENDWDKNKQGEGYDKIIQRGYVQSRDQGLAARPKIFQGEGRESGSLFQLKSYLYDNAPAAQPVEERVETAEEPQVTGTEANYEAWRALGFDVKMPKAKLDKPIARDGVTVTGKSYDDAISGAAENDNILIRKGDNPGKIVMVQISSLLQKEEASDIGNDYYDALYSNRDGYSRPKDFWEIPQWIAASVPTFKDSDVYVVRDIEDAISFLKNSGYDAAMFSAMDANKGVIKDIVDKSGIRSIVGGYINKEYFRTSENTEYHEDLASAAKAMGKKLKHGYDYSHFTGTKTVPRLEMSKGCLHKCAFCTVPKILETSSKAEIMEQVDSFKDLDFKLMYLNDKTFGQADNFSYLVDVNNKIKETNSNFDGFIIQTTAPSFLKMSDDFIKKSGIKFVELGMESYNDDILRKIKKPHTTKLIDKAVEKIRKNKISFIPNVMVGLAGEGWIENEGTYGNTLEFLEKNKDVISHSNVYILAAYEGTEVNGTFDSGDAIDSDENVMEKSWLKKDQKVHDSFYSSVLDFSTDRLVGDKPKTKFAIAPPVDTPAFKKWFGKSKVVDEDGKPIIAYHGTEKAGFKIFDTNKAKSSGGFHFAKERSLAKSYSSSGQDAIIPSGEEVFNDPQVAADVGIEVERVFYVINSDDITIGDEYNTEEELVEDVDLDDGDTIEARYNIYQDGDIYDDALTMEAAIETIDELDFARAPGIYEVYLRIEDPYIVDWEGKNWDESPTEKLWNIYDNDGEYEDSVYSEEEANEIIKDEKGYTVEEVDSPLFQDINDAVRMANDMEADGLIVENIYDSGGYGYGGEGGTEYIVFDPNQVKSIYNKGTFDTNRPETNLMFAGEKGKGLATTPLFPEFTMLGSAIKAREEGQDPVDIFRETDWFLAKDGKWRYFIDDEASKLIDIDGRGVRRANNYKLGTYKLSDILGHDELYRIYPFLKDMNVIISNAMAEDTGAFYSVDKVIVIRPGDRITFKSALLHEVQHAVQDYEGFAAGGSVEKYFNDLMDAVPLDTDISASLIGNLEKKARKMYYETHGEVEAFDTQDRWIEGMVGLPQFADGVPGELVMATWDGLREYYDSHQEMWKSDTPVTKLAAATGKKPILERIFNNKKSDLPPVIHEIWNTREKPMYERVAGALDSVSDVFKGGEKSHILIQKTLDKKHFIKYKGADESYRQHSAATGIASIFDAFFHDGLLEMKTDGTVMLKEGSEGFLPWLERSLGSDWEKFLMWVAAKRSKELSKDDREKLMTDEKREEIFAATKEEFDAEWERYADELHEINKTFLDIAEQAGIINPKSRAKWEQHYYIPFHRVFEDVEERAAFLSKPDKIDAQIKRLVGSEEKLQHPLDSLTKTWMHLLSESMTNVAQKSAYDFFTDTDSGLVSDVSNADVITKADVRTGAVLHLGKKGADVNNILMYLEGGKQKFFKVDDINLFDAMSRLNSQNAGKVVGKMFRLPKNLLTYGATFGVGFRVRNIIRDTLHVAMIENSFIPFLDSWKGLLKVFKNDKAYQEMKASGFSFGGSYNRAGNPKAAADYIARKVGKKKRTGGRKNIFLNTTADVLEWWEKLGEAFENAARVQLYTKLRAEGLPIQEAGYRAKDLLDFSKSGQHAAVQFLVQTIPFLNARMQGLYKLGQTAVSEDPGVQKNLFLRATMLTLASLALWWANKDDEDYKKLEDWEKWTYYHIFIGDNHVRIPKPFEVGAIASTMFEAAADAAYGNEDAGYLLDAAMSTITQTFAIGPPQLFVPAIEMYANKSLFTGRPILSSSMKKLPAGEQFEPWTPRVLQLAGKMGISPKQAEQILRSTLGAIATTLFITTDAMLMPFFPVSPEKKFSQYPVANLFYRDSGEPPKNTKYVTRFYEMGRDINEIAQGISHMKATGRPIAAMEEYEKNKGKVRYRKSYLRAQKAVSKINKTMKRIMVDSKMSAEDKDKAIDKWLKIRNQKIKIMYDKLNSVM